MAEVRAHLDAVTKEAADGTPNARRATARKRGAADRLARLEASLHQMPDVVATKKRSGSKDGTPRVSTTDPDARVMKMGDGGFRPALNVRFVTTTDEARVIVGVDVTNRGSDMGESTPMLDQIEKRTGTRPDQYLVDGGFAEYAALEHAADSGVTVYAPVRKPEGAIPATRTRRARATARRSSRGELAWAPTRRKRSARSARPPPKRRRTAASTSWR